MRLWRIVKGVLPLQCWTTKRMALRYKICLLDGVEDESEFHLFLECEVARLAWFGSFLGTESETLRGCLDWVKTELYNSIFITHNLKQVGPMEEFLFGIIFYSCSHHSKLKKNEFE